jgi:hypothetical protein
MPTLEITINDLLQDVVKYRDACASGDVSEHTEFYLKGLDFAMWLVTAAFQRVELEHLNREAFFAAEAVRVASVVS